MANKYLWHGNTFCGDGTTADAAASDGAVGAWNNINVLTGTAPAFGSIAAGNTVYIRSKDASDADITITQVANNNIGIAGASIGNPVHWILDSGSVWTGIDGILTVATPGPHYVTVQNNNNITCKRDRFVFYLSTSYSAAYIDVFKCYFTAITGVMFDYGLSNVTRGAKITMGINSYDSQQFVDCTFRIGGRYLTTFGQANYGLACFLNCDFELTNASETEPLFSPGAYNAVIRVIGGSIYGAGVTSSAALFNAGSGIVELIGCAVPKVLPMPVQFGSTGSYPQKYFSIVSADGEAGSYYAGVSGAISSRNDGLFPTLNATLDDSVSTPWSWWAYPDNAYPAIPLQITSTLIYSDTPATKTLKVNILVSDDFTAIDKSNCYIVVGYTNNTTGNVEYLRSLDVSGGALESSVAGWSAVTYGAIALSKKQLVVTTTSAIKQNSVVTVSLLITQNSTNTTDILFVCPVPVLT